MLGRYIPTLLVMFHDTPIKLDYLVNYPKIISPLYSHHILWQFTINIPPWNSTIISSVYPTKPSIYMGFLLIWLPKGSKGYIQWERGNQWNWHYQLNVPNGITIYFHWFPIIYIYIYLGKLQYYTTLKEGYIGIIPLTNIY